MSYRAQERREMNLADELLRFDPVRRLIYGAAYRWTNAYQDKRLTFEDFLSAFYEAVWRVIDAYTWATDFYLYETMSRAIQKRGLSILRATGTDKRRAFHEALPLADEI
ncbi:hypothetical protein [Paenibacillus sp. DMB5]|uniref:hypothetical protein n=1 Tax=Paenibacillus sp. DMB5 TaxID=1780103 RepID=UPI000FE14721|nr:hypothetical protein [Paenibacillus sp. DMB5]